jgi:hypothetical protein
MSSNDKIEDLLKLLHEHIEELPKEVKLALIDIESHSGCTVDGYCLPDCAIGSADEECEFSHKYKRKEDCPYWKK